MKILVLILVVIFVGVGGAQTTDKTIEKIGGVYTDVSEKARLAMFDDDHGQYGDLVMSELVINKRQHQWRAVGIFGETYRFFYKGGDSEEHLYPDQLVFVTVARNSSNRSYAEEFLYDDAGRLIFYFQKANNDDLVPAERRIYFAVGRPLRIIEDGKTRDHLTPKDLAAAKSVADEALKIKDVFVRSIKL